MKKLFVLIAVMLTACGGNARPMRVNSTPPSESTSVPISSTTTVSPTTTSLPLTTSTITRKIRSAPTTTIPYSEVEQTTSADGEGYRTSLGSCLVTDAYTAERYGLIYDPSCYPKDQ